MIAFMTSRQLLKILCIALASVLSARGAGVPPDDPKVEARPSATEPEAHPDLLLVGYRKGMSAPSRQSMHAALGVERVRSFRRIPVDVVRVKDRAKRDGIVRAYRARAEVRFVEPNYRLRALSVPNDPRFGELWGLLNTGQDGGTPGADIGVTNVWATLGTGSTNVLVAVIDTGIDYTHPDLVENVWSNAGEIAGNGIDDDGNGIVDDIHGARWNDGGGDPTSGDPMDGNGHGTHVSGTIGGIGDNGIGVAGVNWRVRIMGLKFLSDSGSGYTADAISAIEYAIDKGARLSNNSWGGGGFSQALKDAIDAAGAAGQLFVAAAGNSNSDNDALPSYPATYESPNILAVASSDRNDARSGFSSYGRTTVDLAAPGSDILSSTPGNEYSVYSGTSMATPHAAGAAALLWSLYPGATWEQVKTWLMDGTRRRAAWRNRTATAGLLHVDEAARLAALPAGVAPAENFAATGMPDTNRVELSWTTPANAEFDHVLVRRGAGNFPDMWSAGDLVYSGALEAATDEGLAIGDNGYYGIWAVHTMGGTSYVSAARFASVRAGGEADDYFTEHFAAFDFDLAYRRVTFVPTNTLEKYAAFVDYADAFGTDPAGSTNLFLSDDDAVEVPLGDGATVSLYGDTHSSLFIGSNGYITFGAGDSGYSEGIAAHFGLPRISAFFDDLNPDAGGTISWKQLADRAVVTYDQVPEWGQAGANTFQVELFFDGVIRITWLEMAAQDGLVGLSEGMDEPANFVESNFVDYLPSSDDPLWVLPSAPSAVRGAIGGPFAPTGLNYRIVNRGTSDVSWSASATNAWLAVAPTSGAVPAGSTALVSVAWTAEAQALPLGVHTAVVVFADLDAGSNLYRQVRLTVDPTLCEAADACHLPWTTGGTSVWFGQTVVTADGQDAPQSGPLDDLSESWIETTIAGPGLLTFDWKVSSETTYDFLRFDVDGVERASISGEVDWSPYAHELPAGTHPVRWRYTKDEYVRAGADAGWIDRVAFRAYQYEPATDHAGLYGAAHPFTNGANRGRGFMPWKFIVGAGASNSLGSSLAGSGDINSTNGLAFRFYGGPGDAYAEAVRPFHSSMRSGDVFRVKLAYNWNGGARGVNVLAADDYELFNVNFGADDTLSFKWGNGSSVNLSTNWSPTTILHVAATQLDANQLRVNLLRSDGYTTNFTSSGLPAPAAKVKFYNGGHPGDNVQYALWVNDLSVERSPAYDEDGDGLPDWWEVWHFGSRTNAAPTDPAANGESVEEAWIADLDPADPATGFPRAETDPAPAGLFQLRVEPTSTARVYRVQWSTNLTASPQEWTLYPPEKTGTGSAVVFTVTNDLPGRHYRTGVRVP